MVALLLLAIALAMDAVAVALVRGAVGGPSIVRAIELGLIFGLAQGLMPFGGWALGEAFAEVLHSVDHWVAFVVLALLGANMIRSALSGEERLATHPASWHFVGLLTAALATSVDAAAAGLTLDMLGVPILAACLAIGAVTAALCGGAYLVGGRSSTRLATRAELFGGVVLIGRGLKILVEHLGAGIA